MEIALKNARATIREITAKSEAILARAQSSRRELSAEERGEVEGLLAEGRRARDVIANAEADADIRGQIDSLTPRDGSGSGGGFGVTRTTQTLGQQFTNSDAMEFLKNTRNSRGGLWTTPAVELFDLGMQAAVLTEDAASGGDLVVPDYQPGIQRLPTRPLHVAGLIAPGTTDSNLISYMKETTFTNAAAPVAEGAVKPESTLIFDGVSDEVRKIAHWLPVTNEILEDVPQLRSYIDARLRDGVDLTEDDQLLNGSGTAPAIRGILNRTGLAAPVARGTDTNADAILRQIAALTTATSVQPDGIVLHPNAWLNIRLSKSADGLYVSGAGPFTSSLRPMLWGLPVALSTTIASTTALVGAFRARAQLFRHGGLRVTISNSHASFFIENKVAILAERREALAVYQPAAFGTVTGLLTS